MMLSEELRLGGSIVRLEPMSLADAEPLARIGLDPGLWTLQPRQIVSFGDMRAYVQAALDDRARSVSLPFVIVSQQSGALIGSTRYMDYAPVHRRVEIGATWLTAAAQRTGANTETKLLMLSYAFDSLSVEKVVLKTEALNAQSRRAIERIGAIEEGIFRQHLWSDSGRPRDMVFYAVFADMWPAVRNRLQARLSSHD
jgi:N-acetyltransferase